MKKAFLIFLTILTVVLLIAAMMSGCGKKNKQVLENIPLPEHPRPDFSRDLFVNLNGKWEFQPDSSDFGETASWQVVDSVFTKKINVPFSWASPLSGVGNPNIHIAWYAKDLIVPNNGKWRNKQIYLVIGASDFATTVWLNGKKLGTHEGGYTPFEFNLTPDILRSANRLVIKVEDKPVPGRSVGKQVYGQAKGIWQTVYLEGRPLVHIKNVFFYPDIDKKKVGVKILLSAKAEKKTQLFMAFSDSSMKTFKQDIPAGKDSLMFDIPVPKPRLWSPDDPYLYDVDLKLGRERRPTDLVHTYFGMRKIGTGKLPGTDFTYVTLNNKPFYIKMTLDQSYHEQGFYTFPSDSFMKEEMLRAKNIGLNSLRIHIKTEIPRKLYWADKLGVLIMQDIPNTSGDPTDTAKANWRYTAQNQIIRDFNHPAIFSWVLFNETWGLKSKNINEIGVYLPQTRAWVDSIYKWAKVMDTTRLVEDNSPCDEDHVDTDLNSWHKYLPGREWSSYLDFVVENTKPGSQWNFVPGEVQKDQPMFNSEFGSVWGYDKGTGDIDLAYEYHIAMNEFRKRPKISGWIFTEFHDVINEWNGYYRFDRSLKDYGLGDLCPGMTLKDLHNDIYIIPGGDFQMVVKPKAKFFVPFEVSFMTDKIPSAATIKNVLYGWNRLGERKDFGTSEIKVSPKPFALVNLDSLELKAPDEECLAILCSYLVSSKGDTLSRNFYPFRVLTGEPLKPETDGKDQIVLRCEPDDYSNSKWTIRQGTVQNGMKVWGTGDGFFEYSFPWPKSVKADKVDSVEFLAELSSRPVLGKDTPDSVVSAMGIDNVVPKGIDPGYNPNSYPMTDGVKHPSALMISLNDLGPQTAILDDDPADHRGLLSWMNQIPGALSWNKTLNITTAAITPIRPKMFKPAKLTGPLAKLVKEEEPEQVEVHQIGPWRLQEAGTYGYPVRIKFSADSIQKASLDKAFKVRLKVGQSTDKTGGLAVYGSSSGRYPFGPTLIIKLKPGK